MVVIPCCPRDDWCSRHCAALYVGTCGGMCAIPDFQTPCLTSFNLSGGLVVDSLYTYTCIHVYNVINIV